MADSNSKYGKIGELADRQEQVLEDQKKWGLNAIDLEHTVNLREKQIEEERDATARRLAPIAEQQQEKLEEAEVAARFAQDEREREYQKIIDRLEGRDGEKGLIAQQTAANADKEAALRTVQNSETLRVLFDDDGNLPENLPSASTKLEEQGVTLTEAEETTLTNYYNAITSSNIINDLVNAAKASMTHLSEEYKQAEKEIDKLDDQFMGDVRNQIADNDLRAEMQQKELTRRFTGPDRKEIYDHVGKQIADLPAERQNDAREDLNNAFVDAKTNSQFIDSIQASPNLASIAPEQLEHKHAGGFNKLKIYVDDNGQLIGEFKGIDPNNKGQGADSLVSKKIMLDPNDMIDVGALAGGQSLDIIIDKSAKGVFHGGENDPHLVLINTQGATLNFAAPGAENTAHERTKGGQIISSTVEYSGSRNYMNPADAIIIADADDTRNKAVLAAKGERADNWQAAQGARIIARDKGSSAKYAEDAADAREAAASANDRITQANNTAPEQSVAEMQKNNPEKFDRMMENIEVALAGKRLPVQEANNNLATEQGGHGVINVDTDPDLNQGMSYS